MTKNAGDTDWRWIEAAVDRGAEHIQLFFREDKEPAALVAPPKGHLFRVQLLTKDGEALSDVRRELNLYLIELHEEFPWNYAKYHCSTASNMYSSVRWAYVPGGTLFP